MTWGPQCAPPPGLNRVNNKNLWWNISVYQVYPFLSFDMQRTIMIMYSRNVCWVVVIMLSTFFLMMLVFVVSLQRLASNIECAFLKDGRVILKVTALNKRPTQYLKSHAESESISLEVSHLRIYQQPSNKLSTFGKKVRILRGNFFLLSWLSRKWTKSILKNKGSPTHLQLV